MLCLTFRHRLLTYSWQVMLSGFTVDEVNGSANYFVTALLFMFFTYFINIVMLNLLIAIMGDIFDRIQENAKAEFMFARANIIIEFEALLSDSHKRNEEVSVRQGSEARMAV